MNTPKLKLTSLAMGAVCMSLVACGPDTEKNNGEGETIDPVTTQQAITGNTTDIATKLSRTIAFLETSDLFNTGIDSAFSAGGETTCAAPIDPNTGEPDTTYCDTETDVAVEFDTNVEDEAAELANFLETYIFVDGNVESEDGTSVTYLLDGSIVCDQGDEPVDPECVSNIDEAEIRIVATSPQSGDIDLDLLIGPNKANPFSFEVHSDLLAAEVDLAGIKASANHIGAIAGEAVDLPDTMEGRLRGELQVEGDEKITAALSVLTAVNVGDGDYSFALATSSPAWSVTADGTAKTITSVSNLGALDASFPVNEEEYDYETDTTTTTSYQMGLHLGGLTGTTVLDAATEVFSVIGLGLGSTTTTMSVDGAEFIAIDLNANDGRSLDLTAKAGANDTVELELSPKLDLSVALKFAAAAGKLGEVDDWMLDDVLSVVIDGAAKPKLSFGESGMKVVDGSMSMSLQNAGTAVTVDAGMCILPQDDIIVEGTVEPGTEPTPVESTNPLEDIEVGACQ